MDVPLYVVCERCAFLRAFAESASGTGGATPQRCPACGRDINVHGPEERFPSAYVARTSRKLYATPPLRT